MMPATVAPPLACPAWCASEDHEWGEGPDVWPVIAHEVTFKNDVVSILVFVEDEMTPDGVVRRDPVVSVDIDATVCHSLSAGQAVLLMKALSSATTAADSAASVSVRRGDAEGASRSTP